GIIGMMVQLFYAWRIHRLLRNVWIVAIVVITSLVGGLSSIGTSIGVAMLPQFAGLQRLEVIIVLWLVGTALCDVIIATALSWHLREHHTGLSHTDSIITRIIQFTMLNGLLTAGFVIADVTASLGSLSGLHLSFNFALVKPYGNSVMSSLNLRHPLFERQANGRKRRFCLRRQGTR
ncbi:hypothetical protein WOLCODRAFT_72014, partial [Wolfiporia cocos MD-104 SS10]